MQSRLVKFLENKNVVINDKPTFYNLLNKLNQNEIQLLFMIVKYLFSKNYSFYINTYETDGDLENLYFVIHYDNEVPNKYIEQELLNLYEFTRRIDKDKTLWFVGFVSTT